MSEENKTLRTPDKNDPAGFQKSLSALRELLLLDTPTTNMLQENQYDHLQQEVEKLKAALRTEKEAEKDLEARLEASRAEIDKERELRKELEIANRDLLKEKQDRQGKHNVLKSVRQGMEEKIQQLEEESKSAKAQADNKISSLETKLEKVTQEKKEALETVGSMEAQKLTANRRVEEIQGEQKRLADEAQQERSSMQAILKTWELKVSAQQQKHDEVESENKQLKDKLDKMEKQATVSESAKQATQEVEELQRELQSAVTDRTRWKQELTESQSHVESLKAKIAKLEQAAKQSASASVSTTDLEAKLGAKEKLLESKEKLVSLLMQKQKKLESEHTAKVTQLEEDLAEIKEELQCAETEVIRCRGLLEAEKTKPVAEGATKERKRPAEEGSENALKAKLLAKKKQKSSGAE